MWNLEPSYGTRNASRGIEKRWVLMGQVMPAPAVRPRGASRVVTTIILAFCYIALVPAVTVAALWVGATYFPGETGRILGPVLSKVMSQYQPGLAPGDELRQPGSAVDQITARLSKLEDDVKAISERLEKEVRTPPQAQQAIASDELQKAISESRARSALVSSLAALTVARAESLSGNRELAIREARFAAATLQNAGEAYQDALSLVQRAADELAKGSLAADDWLAVAWRTLAQQIIK